MNPITAPSLLTTLAGTAEASLPVAGEGTAEGAGSPDFGALLADLETAPSALTAMQQPAPALSPTAPIAVPANVVAANPASPLPLPGNSLPPALPDQSLAPQPQAAGEEQSLSAAPAARSAPTLAIATPRPTLPILPGATAEPEQDQPPTADPEAGVIVKQPVPGLPAYAAIRRPAQPGASARHEPELAQQSADDDADAAQLPKAASEAPTVLVPAAAPLAMPDLANSLAGNLPQLQPPITRAATNPEPRGLTWAQAAAGTALSQNGAVKAAPALSPPPQAAVIAGHAASQVHEAAPIMPREAALSPPQASVRVTIEPTQSLPSLHSPVPAQPLVPAHAAIPAAAAALASPVMPEGRAGPAPDQVRAAAPGTGEAQLPQIAGLPADAQAVQPFASAPTQPQPAMTQTTLAAPAEARDFTALLDRLVAAREAMRSEPTRVTMALPHAEFGQVRLDFRQDERGLSVSIASSDPGFARAASAALPLAQSAPSADAGARQGSEGQARAHTDAHGSGSGTAGSRGGSAGSQGEREPARNAFVGQRADRHGAEASSQQGIFA